MFRYQVSQLLGRASLKRFSKLTRWTHPTLPFQVNLWIIVQEFWISYSLNPFPDKNPCCKLSADVDPKTKLSANLLTSHQVLIRHIVNSYKAQKLPKPRILGLVLPILRFLSRHLVPSFARVRRTRKSPRWITTQRREPKIKNSKHIGIAQNYRILPHRMNGFSIERTLAPQSRFSFFFSFSTYMPPLYFFPHPLFMLTLGVRHPLRDTAASTIYVHPH